MLEVKARQPQNLHKSTNRKVLPSISVSNPEHRPDRHQTDNKQRTKSVFLTEFARSKYDQPQPHHQRSSQNRENKSNPKSIDKFKKVNSWVDLNRLKIKFRAELLKRKSKEQIFEENMAIIERIQEVAPKVETWNHLQTKRSGRSSSCDIEIIKKNRQLRQKLEEVDPKIFNWNLYKAIKSPRAAERKQNQHKIFQDNIKIIQRVEESEPKVSCWSEVKLVRTDQLERNRKEWRQKLMEENLKIIERVETVPPKIHAWADITELKKKLKLKRQKDESPQKIRQLQRLIQQAEQRLRDQQLKQKAKKMSRHKTLPSRIVLHMKQTENRHKTDNQKIEKVRPSVDCWNKNQFAELLINNRKARTKTEAAIQQGCLIAHKNRKQLKYMERKQQIRPMGQLPIATKPTFK